MNLAADSEAAYEELAAVGCRKGDRAKTRLQQSYSKSSKSPMYSALAKSDNDDFKLAAENGPTFIDTYGFADIDQLLIVFQALISGKIPDRADLEKLALEQAPPEEKQQMIEQVKDELEKIVKEKAEPAWIVMLFVPASLYSGAKVIHQQVAQKLQESIEKDASLQESKR